MSAGANICEWHGSVYNSSTVHPRLSEQVELKYVLGRSDTQRIRIIEEEHLPTKLSIKVIIIVRNSHGMLNLNAN